MVNFRRAPTGFAADCGLTRGLFLRFHHGFLPKVLLLFAALTLSAEPINYMGMGTVQPLRLSDAGFLKKLRVVVKDSDRVVLTKHAKLRMRQRRVNQRQVMECLRKGRIYEPAHLTIHGDWMATLEHQYAGDAVRVVVAIERQEDGELAVVVTVMN
jgi:hypothetical protein